MSQANLTGFLLLLFIKHFICDFPLQMFPWMYKNKGIYGHPGGVIHAAIHAFGTWVIVLFFSIELASGLMLLDFFLHYHIDWAKMNINRIYNLRPDNSEWFWVLLGFDQFLHAITYFLFLLFL